MKIWQLNFELDKYDNLIPIREFTVEEMAQMLVDEYGIDMELALTDSKALCQSWIDAGIAE